MMSISASGAIERLRWRALAHLVACIAVGVLAGVLWVALSPRGSYEIDEQYHATLSERAYAEVIGADATFTLITAGVGLIVGCLTWIWFSHRGRLVVGLTVVGATLMSLVTWQTGQLVGGSGLMERLAAAQPGDFVRMDLQLNALGALAVGPFAAITPIMLLAAFLPERSVDERRAEEPAR